MAWTSASRHCGNGDLRHFGPPLGYYVTQIGLLNQVVLWS
jgi:hypothetical protein